MPAKADETLKFRAMQHPTSVQSQQVGDVNAHVLGLSRLSGIVFFPDGSTGTVVAIATFDSVVGSEGINNGYGTIIFADCSELWTKCTGTVKYVAGRVPQKGPLTVTGGKGRYAGAKGDGTWEGDQSQSIVLPMTRLDITTP